ncbi:MAG: YbaK/EbsC family protein [Thermoplasmata archaeon]
MRTGSHRVTIFGIVFRPGRSRTGCFGSWSVESDPGRHCRSPGGGPTLSLGRGVLPGFIFGRVGSGARGHAASAHKRSARAGGRIPARARYTFPARPAHEDRPDEGPPSGTKCRFGAGAEEPALHRLRRRALLCILGCDRAIDTSKLRDLVGREVRLAEADEVLRHTGSPIGNVPSVVPGLRKFLDATVTELELVSICSCLDNDAGINLRPGDLLRALDNCQVVRISPTIRPGVSEDQVRDLAKYHRISKEVAKSLLAREGSLEIFESMLRDGLSARVAGSVLTSPPMALLDPLGAGASDDALQARTPALSEIVRMVEKGVISRSSAAEVLRAVLSENADPAEYVRAKGLMIVQVDLLPILEQVLASDPTSQDALASGDRKIVRFLIGKVIAEAGAAVDPRAVAKLVQDYALERRSTPV